MTWEKDNDLTFISRATTKDSLIKDLEIVLQKINLENIITLNQALFYIDATNGNIFISDYDDRTNETNDEKQICFEVEDFLEEYPNSYDFDQEIISTIKQVLRTNTGEELKNRVKVFYQTEEDEPVIIIK